MRRLLKNLGELQIKAQTSFQATIANGGVCSFGGTRGAFWHEATMRQNSAELFTVRNRERRKDLWSGVEGELQR